MALTKYKLENLIEYCDERNIDNQYGLADIKGISTGKEFIETKANMDGVMLDSYNIISKNQFAYVADTSRRGDKIALAYNTEERNFLVSSIYTIFRITHPEILDSDYLFMFFNRPEFDRYARYHSWGSAREVFTYEDMCDVQIPLPSLEVQQNIVNMYKCYTERRRIAAELKEKIKAVCPILIKGSLENM